MHLSLPAMTTAALLIVTLTSQAAHAQEPSPSMAEPAPVVVAVLDTGIAPHPALGWRVMPDGIGRPGGVVLPGYDFVSDPWTAGDGDGWDPDPSDRGDGVRPRDLTERPECRPRASSWHGTNVAGTVAAQRPPDVTGMGIARDSRILPVRIMGRCGGNTADVAAGLLWAVGEQVPDVPVNPHPAKIVNVSLSGAADRCPRALQTAIDIANERGATVVVAAGSSARDTAVSTPANCAGVIVVGSTDRAGERSPTSNYGAEVTLSALGGDMSTGKKNGIYTTTNKGSYRPRTSGYGRYEGSSAAAARVTGALTLLADRHPTTSPAELTGLLMSNVEPFAPGQCDQGEGNCGQGILDLDRLIAGR
jgi:serine protease